MLLKTNKQMIPAFGLLTALLLGIFALQPSFSVAGPPECKCGEEKDGSCSPCCDCGKDDDGKCLPCKFEICHNIGGPRDLGANCDGTGDCSFTTDEGTIDVPKDFFLGIIIGFKAVGPALKAHLNHGDGFVIDTFYPPLHLASEGQNHQASNVECFAKRAITTQPPEPGN